MDYLIVVDMQKDFVDGSLGTPEAKAILPMAEERIRSFQGKVLFTRDTHHEDYLQTQEGKFLPVSHCIENTKGWEICDSLQPYCTEPPINKITFGSVDLIHRLSAENRQNPISSVTLIGVCTDICVISNALLIKAALPEIPIFVDAACCAGVTPESHRRALKAMKMCQIQILNE